MNHSETHEAQALQVPFHEEEIRIPYFNLYLMTEWRHLYSNDQQVNI